MPITTRNTRNRSLMQRFRMLSEGFLLQVAQRETMRQHLGQQAQHAPKKGLIYKLLPIVFLPGYRLTPWPVKKRLLRLFFIHKEQRWPERPWEQGEQQ